MPRYLAAIFAAAVSFGLLSEAQAGLALKISPNPNGSLDGSNRSGASTGPMSPVGFTCVGKGDGTGSINEDTDPETGWDFNVAASDTFGKYLCYADAGAGDIQVAGEIQDDYGGFLAGNSLLEVGITEGTADDDYQFACFSLYTSGPSRFSIAYGIPSAGLTIVHGPAGLTRPGYCAVTYDLSSTTVKGFYCPAAAAPANCVEIASTSRTLTDPQWYAGGKSFSSTQPMTGSMTDLEFVNTIDVYTPSDPGGSDPVWDTEISNQTWTEDTAITSVNVAANCSISSGSKSFSGSGLPTGITISSAGVISGTPTTASTGNATITCSDGTNTADEIFSWSVNPATGSCTGTTHQYTSATSITSINAASHASGDCVQLQAGGTWNVSSTSNVLKPKSGVTYGRYGSGADPIIDCTNAGTNWPSVGCIDIRNVSNVVIEDFEVRGVADEDSGFLFLIIDAQNITARRIYAHASEAGCVAMHRATNIVLDTGEVTDCDGNPNESIAVNSSSDGVEVANWYSHGNGHAAINISRNAKNVWVHDNIFETTTDDPTCYIERAENVEFGPNNICRDLSTSNTGKPIFHIGIEGLGDCATRYNRHIEVHHNLFHDADGATTGGNYLTGAWIKETAYTGCALGNSSADEQLQHDINIHHNTFAFENPAVATFGAALRFIDERDANEDAGDWSLIVVECNIFWSTGVARAQLYVGGITATTNRYNLYQSGETFSPSNASGTNAVFTSDVLFTNQASDDFTLQAGSPARNACYDGTNIGAF